MRTKELFKFIRERHSIYGHRMFGFEKPWTTDPILQSYRFCNVYRELDTVTQWIAQNWRVPYAADPDLWFALVVARLVNWPETLKEIARSVLSNEGVRWRPSLFVDLLEYRMERGEKVFSGAYLINQTVKGGAGMARAEYLADIVLAPIWDARIDLRPIPGQNWHLWHAALMEYQGMGSFMAAQVVADLKYAPEHLHKAADWWTFAAPGPGSKRGLNRVFGGSPDKPWKGNSWSVSLRRLQEEIDQLVAAAEMPRLHAQDLQNCLCEFDKYERVRLGEGRPRSTYNGLT